MTKAPQPYLEDNKLVDHGEVEAKIREAYEYIFLNPKCFAEVVYDKEQKVIRVKVYPPDLDILYEPDKYVYLAFSNSIRPKHKFYDFPGFHSEIDEFVIWEANSEEAGAETCQELTAEEINKYKDEYDLDDNTKYYKQHKHTAFRSIDRDFCEWYEDQVEEAEADLERYLREQEQKEMEL